MVFTFISRERAEKGLGARWHRPTSMCRRGTPQTQGSDSVTSLHGTKNMPSCRPIKDPLNANVSQQNWIATPDSDLDLPFSHLKTPNLDFPLTGGDIAEELSWQDVLIEIAGDVQSISIAWSTLAILNIFWCIYFWTLCDQTLQSI